MLRDVPDAIHVVVLIYFHLIRLYCATKPDTSNRQKNDFGLTCDVIDDPKINNASFHR